MASPIDEAKDVPPVDSQPGLETPPIEQGMAPFESGTAAEEGRFLNYVGHQIPWFVRLLWIFFWSASAWYVIRWLLPALQSELMSPP